MCFFTCRGKWKMCCAFSSNSLPLSLALVFAFVLSFHQSLPTILSDMKESAWKQALFAGKSIDFFGFVGFSFFCLYSFLWLLVLFFFTLLLYRLGMCKTMYLQNGLACKFQVSSFKFYLSHTRLYRDCITSSEMRVGSAPWTVQI